MHLDNGILMRGRQIVLPNSLRYEVTREFHMQTGYQGEARILQAVASNYMWKGMRSYIEDVCKHCQCCLVNKASRAPKEPLEPYTLEELKPRTLLPLMLLRCHGLQCNADISVS